MTRCCSKFTVNLNICTPSRMVDNLIYIDSSRMFGGVREIEWKKARRALKKFYLQLYSLLLDIIIHLMESHSFFMKQLPPRFSLRQRHDLRENRCPKSSNSIPPLLHREACRITPTIPTTQDIREALVSLRVQPWIEETEWRFARGDERVIDESEDTGRQGRGG